MIRPWIDGRVATWRVTAAVSIEMASALAAGWVSRVCSTADSWPDSELIAASVRILSLP